jgi:D-3-phosphoglycerate dehydrogenase / 2-oxoglutarate reductase
MIRILANDGLHEDGKLLLEEAGYEVDVMKVPQEELPNVLSDYDVVIVRSATKIRQPLIDKCPNLKVIARGGVGEENIDAAYARNKGIEVMTTPEASSNSVAELVFAHLFSIARHLHHSNREMTSNKSFDFKALKRSYSEGFELEGKRLGIIGFGRVGQEVARKALGLGMEIMPVDYAFESVKVEINILNNKSIGITIDVPTYSLEEVLENADIITVHVPYDGAPIIGAAEIHDMKDGVVLINASRGGTVDEQALLDGLNSGKIRAAGIDVYENEPNPRLDLIHHPHVSVSPHIGAATLEAQRRVSLAVADRIIAFFGD